MRPMLNRFLPAAPALAFALLAAAPAGAAVLRPMTELAGPIVKLSDLFDDAGPQAGRALGPGPEPGESLTVLAPQLAAIARQFGVAWRPSSPGDRILLQRPGLPLPREALLAALRTALDGAGAGDGAVELAGFTAPMVAPDAQARPLVEQLDFDAASGRFTAAVAITGSFMEPLHLRVSGRLEAMEAVLVASHRLDAGVPLSAQDLQPARLRAALLRGEVVRSAAQVAGLAARRPLAAGQPVPLADLGRAVAVARGARVLISLDQPGLALSSLGEAQEEGAVGERIRVLNPSSRAVVLAEITGPGAVRLEPGSMPLRAADGAAHATRLLP